MLSILTGINGKGVCSFLQKFFHRYPIKCFPLTCQNTMPRLEDHPSLKRTLLIDFLPLLSCYTKFRVLCKSTLCLCHLYLISVQRFNGYYYVLVLGVESRELQYKYHVLRMHVTGIGNTMYMLWMLMLSIIHEAGTIISLLIERLSNFLKVICKKVTEPQI